MPMPYAQNLENAMIPTVESIKDAIRKTYIQRIKLHKISYVNKIKLTEKKKIFCVLYLLVTELFVLNILV